MHTVHHDSETGLLKTRVDFKTEEGLQIFMSNWPSASRDGVNLGFPGEEVITCPNLTVSQLPQSTFPMADANSPEQSIGWGVTDVINMDVVDLNTELTACHNCTILQANWDESKEQVKQVEQSTFDEMERLEERISQERAQKERALQQLEEERKVREATIQNYEQMLQGERAVLEQERRYRETVERELQSVEREFQTERQLREQWDREMMSSDQKLLMTLRQAFDGIARFTLQQGS